MKRAARLVALVALVLAPSAPAAFGSPRSPRASETELTVDAAAITWSNGKVSAVVEQSGSLAGRPLTVIAFVDRNMIRTFPTEGRRTRIEVDELELTAGTHELMIKSGTFEARDRFRYLPARIPALGMGGLVLVALAVGVGLRRRRSG